MQDVVSISPHNRVLIIGGTGFLGRYIVQQCLRRGFNVTVLCREPEQAKQSFPSNVRLIKGDIYQLSEKDYIKLLRPFDKLVFSAGVDERAETKGEAIEFFRQANVEPCRKLFSAVKFTPITHAVLLNSIFATLNRKHPELKLADKHPYIQSRVEQNRISQELAGDHCILTTLEIPWVFGKPLNAGHTQWTNLIDYARGGLPVMVCRGGATIISAKSVADATSGALLYPTESMALPIGDQNLTYEQLMKYICEYTGRDDSRITIVSDKLLRELLQTGGLFKNLFNIQSGLNTRYLPEILLREMFFDNMPSKQLLKYHTGDALQALKETVEHTPESTYLKKWRNCLNVFEKKSFTRFWSKKKQKKKQEQGVFN